MSTRFIHSMIIVSAVACGCYAFSQADNGRNSIVAATPTPAPVRTDMSRGNQNDTSKPESGRAAGFSESGAVRDLPTANIPAACEPREVNLQNTLPLKGIKPTAAPIRNKKVIRSARRKN